MRHVRWLVLASLLPAVSASAQSSSVTLKALDFMAGCWTGDAGESTIIEEIYTRPSNNVMLGTTRYLRGDATTMFEFSLITEDSAGITLLPYPGGRPSEDAFLLTYVGYDRAVFEAPEHDFPKRIIYKRESEDALEARIDGGEGSDQVMEWALTKTRCPGS